MLKNAMYAIIAIDLLLRSAGLAVSLLSGAESAFPSLLYILVGVWLIAALLFLAFERGARAHVSQLMYFFIMDFLFTSFFLAYAGWIHTFDVRWYHYLMIGTLFSLLVDAVVVLIAVRHTKYRKYIEIPKEKIKDAEQ